MSEVKTIRPSAVAGMFYPDDPRELQLMVTEFLKEAQDKRIPCNPKALIVPHAGYIYSGPVAASGYVQLLNLKHPIRRVVILGPSHRVALRGLALPTVDAFETPLGLVPIDRAAVQSAADLPGVVVHDAPHQLEHSLEVHIPFLQMTLSDFAIVPFAVGDAPAEIVANVLSEFIHDEKTLVIISSDLSHYHDYFTAQRLDADTSRLIEECRYELLTGDRCCGYVGIRGLLKLARQFNWKVTTVDLRNSGDTSGTRNQVVGYGSYVVEQTN